MKSIDACFAMIRWAIILALACLLLGLFGPTVAATANYLIRPHEVACQNFSVRVPLAWKIGSKNCNGSILIEKRLHLLFDSNNEGGLLFADSMSEQDANKSAIESEQEFRNQYSGNSIVPYQLNGIYKQCFRVDNVPGDNWVTVRCAEATRHVEVNYIGPESGLAEIAALIK
jgi:hypothetical protein